MTKINASGYVTAIKKHIESGKPFMGICVGLQVLFEGSSEAPKVPGFGMIHGALNRFNSSTKSVPHIGWNNAYLHGPRMIYGLKPSSKYYYVHSYKIPYKNEELEKQGWTVATAKYGDEVFVGAIAKGQILATQFHPEKSGTAGLQVLEAFLKGARETEFYNQISEIIPNGLTKRIIACLDVRTNDQGDVVVTKGDKYDVREKSAGGIVRNLGKPIEMAKKYYEQGADEIVFLNIMSFRGCPLADIPLLEILRKTSETVFVPLTVGGGIKDTIDVDGKNVSALEIAKMYFESGADKISIGSDAVIAVEEYIARGNNLTGKTSIEQISGAYGAQAVVVSVDPKRVYLSDSFKSDAHVFRTQYLGPNGEEFCWYACTINGGRLSRNLDVIRLVQTVEIMGAGEILLNCIDKDGTKSGFDLELINLVEKAVTIPVIASSGAGNLSHFEEVFSQTSANAALGAGIFHRGEYSIHEVKQHISQHGLVVRM